jgi:hypothetical protein
VTPGEARDLVRSAWAQVEVEHLTTRAEVNEHRAALAEVFAALAPASLTPAERAAVERGRASLARHAASLRAPANASLLESVAALDALLAREGGEPVAATVAHKSAGGRGLRTTGQVVQFHVHEPQVQQVPVRVPRRCPRCGLTS